MVEALEAAQNDENDIKFSHISDAWNRKMINIDDVFAFAVPSEIVNIQDF